MKGLLLAIALSCLTCVVVAQEFDPNEQPSLRQDVGLFGPRETRVMAYGQPIFSGTFRLILRNNNWCSAFLIDRQWAVTAAHCIQKQPMRADFEFNDSRGSFELKIKVDRQWIAADYSGAGTVLRADWGLLHLAEPAPVLYASYRLARPGEIAVNQRAMSIGYPKYFKRGGSVRVADYMCRVRGLEGDSILSDCNMSRGNSGGPLLVETANGAWVAAGVCSTQFMYGDGEMVRYEGYSSEKANRWTNISLYLGRIYKTIRAN